MNDRSWLDISLPLTKDVRAWPGDEPFSYALSATKEVTGSANVGTLKTSVHTGTHIDAPFHFDEHGKKVHELDVNIYVGKARLIDVTAYDMVGRQELEKFDIEGTERLLLKTVKQNHPTIFPSHYTVLREDAGAYLKEKGIFLIGVDCPSVDPVDSKSLSAHHGLHENGVFILENLLLDEIEPGDYELIALPLAIEGADGSPVRAVIRKRM